jgi:hypothetical protein
MPGDFTPAVPAPNPDSQPRKLARAQSLLDGFQPVMAATAPAHAQPEFAQGQVRIVHHHHQIP